jgi:hypothetical protein
MRWNTAVTCRCCPKERSGPVAPVEQMSRRMFVLRSCRLLADHRRNGWLFLGPTRVVGRNFRKLLRGCVPRFWVRSAVLDDP